MATATVGEPALAGVVPVPLDPALRRTLVRETWFVMLAFLWPAVMAAVVGLVQGATSVGGISDFPTLLHDHVANMILGLLAYLPLLAPVPLALHLLTRTGQPPSSIGLGRPSFLVDTVPGLGLAAASFGVSFGAALILSPLLQETKHAVITRTVGHVPWYYVFWGIGISAVTAVAEEVFVNGYIVTRLAQLGWSKDRSLLLAVALRTSYHVYYGIAFVFTIPLGVFVTRSFQKHRRLNRAIAAHFLYDAVLFTISILVVSAGARVL